MDNAVPQKIDVRMYLGILLFRWQIIAVCFLYSLVGGVFYVNLAPKEYQTQCKVMAYRDPMLEVSGQSARWSSMAMHTYLLQNDKMRERVARKLVQNWGREMGRVDRMILPVTVTRERGLEFILTVGVRGGLPAYNEAFLKVLMEEHRDEWMDIQKTASQEAANMLEKELANLTANISKAESDLIEYQRLHDIARVEQRSSTESRYLGALMERRSMLSTELMLLEAETPALRNANESIVSQVTRLTRETGEVEPLPEVAEDARPPAGGATMDGASLDGRSTKPRVPGVPDTREDSAEHGWRDLRVKLMRLQQREKELAANLQPEHPELTAVRKQIKSIETELEVARQIEMGKLLDRQRALRIAIEALENAEYTWKGKNLLASQRRAELKRIADVVSRFEDNYRTLYARLHDMKVSEELKAEHFRITEPIGTNPKPTWPDPLQVLLMTLAVGLGSGFGIALVVQTFDNKVQTIRDVEQELGVTFLGGVPAWVRGGAEVSVRPIVTEEQSTGAVEAYRALRTSVLAALDKMKEKVVLVTSADSREGKTLTVLNLAIMTAQMGKRVLLIDMDIRRGRLHRSVGLERQPGVVDCLRGRRPLREVIQKTRYEHLDFVPSGDVINDAAEALQATDLRAMFDEVRDTYDYVFIDSSPVLRVTDTVIIASQRVGAVAYVTRVNRTPKPLIKYSLDMLKDAQMLGMILNNIEMHKISSLYYAYQYPNYAYYSNAYSYGYDYYYYDDRHKAPRRRFTFDRMQREFMHWLRRTFLPME